MDCLFCKIVAGEVPARKFYEDEEVVAFHDIGPQAPVHFLVIPKRHIPTLEHLTEADRPLAGHILFTAQRLTREQGCEEGFRVVMNCNDLGGQTVHHIHMHVLGQRQMHWPPG
ncbi:histidine triad nucleotide-binding protein [Pseudomonas aeruginosa]|uniref:histidine triad nucleotide-binding protein n=1 Tax=Pseudomonas aeruginosa TaxID=287 RepID=UPI0018A5298D|nr:histidine triad nucleotide-binding protein [Pseudomonas aeruginosa]QOD46058.1 histidine triad nucleotide-binding protein [Pseudomonas aeruginosa]